MSTPEKRFIGNGAWLFPATYLIHIAEEYWVGEGFPAWASRVAGVELTPDRFLALNAYAWGLMVICILLAIGMRSMRWLIISFAAVVVINGLVHLSGSLITRSYSPGVISGTLLWLPLGAFTLHRGWKLSSRRAFWCGVLVGLLMHAIIFLLAYTGGQTYGARAVSPVGFES